jgi:hypothetical protein
MRFVLCFGLCLISVGAAAQSPPPVQWTGFTDPNEQAFSTEVPQGWHVTGGMLRSSAIVTTPYVRMLSPDRQIYIVIGDPSITFFTEPMRPVFGLPPRTGPTIRPYQSGADYAHDYVMRTIPEVCGNLAIVGQKERPDLAQGPWTRNNPQAYHSAGEVTFTCNLNGTDARGLVAAGTYLYRFSPTLGGGSWTVELLAGYIAPPDRYEAAGAMTVHIVSSFHSNPEWVRNQQAVIDQATRNINAITAAQAQWSQQQLANAQRQQHAMAQQSEQFDRILTNSSPYADPSGNIYHLDNTKTQWIGPGGRIAGTTGAAPGPGWQRLNEVPPQ